MKHRMFPKLVAPGAKSATALPAGLWVASEKIHGAQLVIGIDEAGVSFGKRKDWLASEEPFFGWQMLRAEWTAFARDAWKAVGAPQVVLYAELYGGAYPHPDVAPVPGVSAVQTGVWYAPDLHVAVFDVLAATDDDDPGELLAHHDVAALGLPTPPVLRIASRQDVEALSVRFLTAVPTALGLPPIANNVAEGYVIKPDARAVPSARPGAKRKLPEWDETDIFRGAESFDPRKHLSIDELMSLAARLVNPPRIASARSKVGTNTSAIADEVVVDVLIDLIDTFPLAMAGVDEAVLASAIRLRVGHVPDGSTDAPANLAAAPRWRPG